MQLIISLIILLSFSPVFANNIKTNVMEFSSKRKFASFDESSYSRSRKKKTYFGDKVEYVIDFDPEDHDHHSQKGILFHSDVDGKFYQIDKDTVVVSKRKNSKAVLVNNTTSDAVGNKRTLVIATADPDANRTSKIYTRAFVDAAYFNKTGPSLNNYYKEVSSNRVSFSGTVDERLFVVRNLCRGGNVFESGGADFLLQLVDEEIDLSTYDRLSFVFPEDSNCLAGALGVGTLGLFEFVNSFGKNTKIGINWNISAGVNVENDIYFLKVITHEFGHNFGLQHDNASSCGENIFQGDCDSLEYGGVHSIMGYSPNLAHPNAIHQRDLKWLTSSQILKIEDDNSSETVTLKALASDTDSGIKAIQIRRNDGSVYMVEYRSQLGMARQEYAVNQLTYGGVQIYLNNDSNVNTPRRTDSSLIRNDFKSFASNDTSQYNSLLSSTSFSPSNSFYDPISDIAITTISVNSNEAVVLVQKAFVDDGGGTTAAEDPYVHQGEAITIKTKGLTKKKVLMVYNGDSLANAKIKITIPKAYRKFVKVKKKPTALDFNTAQVNFKFAPAKKFANKLPTNENGQYQLDLNVKVIDEITNEVIYQGISSIFVDPEEL
jgi:M6 family metalloprotease-like protein